MAPYEPRLVYLHGFASGPGSRKAEIFAGALAECGWRLEIPDLNPPDFRRLTVGGILRRIEDLLEGFSGPLGLVGSSLGGYVAALLAAGRLERVDALVLMAPAFGLADRWAAAIGSEALDRWRSEGQLSVYHHAYGDERALAWDFLVEANEHPPYPSIGDRPALVFHGRRDDIVPLENVERFVNEQARASLRVLEDDHSLLQNTGTIVPESIAFLEKHVEGLRGELDHDPAR